MTYTTEHLHQLVAVEVSKGYNWTQALTRVLRVIK